MFHDKNRGTWRVQWSAGAERLSKTFYSKTEARLFEAELKSGLIVAQKYTLETLAEFSLRWLESYCRLEKAAGQVVNDRSVIKRHIAESELGQMRLTAIRKSHVLAFKREIRERTSQGGKPLSTKTVNHILALVKKIFATADDWEAIVKDPARKVKLYPLPKQAFDYWLPSERDFFHRHARHLDRAFTEAVTVAARTGLRRGELAALRRRQVDFGDRLILVNASYCFKTRQRIQTTKNKGVAWVPMDDEVFQLLQAHQLKAPDAPIFELSTLLHASRRLRALAKEVGVKPIRFHDLRHTYASALVRARVDLLTVQKLMRHETVAMTLRYAHLAADQLHEAVARASARALEKPDVMAGNL